MSKKETIKQAEEESRLDKDHLVSYGTCIDAPSVNENNQRAIRRVERNDKRMSRNEGVATRTPDCPHCGSETHRRTTHANCPANPKRQKNEHNNNTNIEQTSDDAAVGKTKSPGPLE